MISNRRDELFRNSESREEGQSGEQFGEDIEIVRRRWESWALVLKSPYPFDVRFDEQVWTLRRTDSTAFWDGKHLRDEAHGTK